ncbi:MAG: hypothetical protein A2937_02420 [Candidatus Yonathbacteria bacterium RIFCSPLOWO2_01_FULL_47_33b]|uniref:M23ase beta-sheet core domain-containing protein n=1 Tax=Candidatus Yonathbacteria bacterium RIFCSPLOWO2_01_FULL_47_33b TaxID=1802727 RepID=A0A1G2SGF0_9BACT|nr:MAG: hypothetical protein A2937_02420 [Candidatus Yonathbacteria bacterium RIFCSPLOWO2_01_FULL_47_33b]
MRTLLYKILTVVFIGAGLLGASMFVSAQTADELRDKISAKTVEIQKLEEEIKKYQNDLVTLAAKKKTLANSIAELNVLRKKLEAEIRITQSKVDTTDLKIRQLTSQISSKEDQIDSLTAAIVEALRAVNEREARSLAQVALSSESFSGVWDDLEALDQFNGKVRESVDTLKDLKVDLEDKQGKQQVEKKNFLTLKSELADRKKIAEANKVAQAKLLAQTNSQESSYKKILNQKIALKDAFEKELRDYESTLKFILDPTSIPSRGTKVFSSPFDNMRITQYFGNTAFAKSGAYNGSGHNGVDFGTPVGTKLKATLGGTVIGTGDTDVTCAGASYGKWILIQHNNGLASLYAHLSLIKVSKNDVVSTGDLIGYTGNTGYSTGPHLHLTVFATAAVKVESRPSRACGGRSYTMPVAALNAYLNPMDYF